jgi:hypothetical protein
MLAHRRAAAVARVPCRRVHRAGAISNSPVTLLTRFDSRHLVRNQGVGSSNLSGRAIFLPLCQEGHTAQVPLIGVDRSVRLLRTPDTQTREFDDAASGGYRLSASSAAIC